MLAALGATVLAGFDLIPLLLDTMALGVEPAELSKRLLEHNVAATAMVGWGGTVAERHLRLVFSREPVERLALLGERLRAGHRARALQAVRR